MIRQRCGATWPLLLFLVGLFALSLTSLRAWQWLSDNKTSAHAPVPPVESPLATANVLGPADTALAVCSVDAPDFDEKPIFLQRATVQMPEDEADGLTWVEPAARIAREYPAEASGREAIPVPPAVAHETLPRVEVGPSLEQRVEIALGPALMARKPTEMSEQPPELLPAKKGDSPVQEELLEQRPLPVQLDEEAPDASGGQSAWREPQALLACLDELAAAGAAAKWASEVAEGVRHLGPALADRSPRASSLVLRLEQLVEQAGSLADSLRGHASEIKLRRAAYALGRRLDVWRRMADGNAANQVAELPKVNAEQLSLSLNEIEAITSRSPEGKAWREYLLVDALREWSVGPTANGEPSAGLVRRALGRLTRAPMTVQQRQFVSRGPFAVLRRELQRATAGPFDAQRLLAHLERYESSRLASDAHLLATDLQSLGLSAVDEHRNMAEQLGMHYRNANIRLAVSAQLLNRLIPSREPEYAPVCETVLGVPVRGKSLTSSDLAVRLMPDPTRMLLALEVTGQVESQTSSTSGPATFFNDGAATYTAWKPLEIDMRGIHVGPTEVRVSNRLRLRGLQTNFDGIPLFSGLVHEIALSQHEKRSPAFSRETQRKIAAKARERIDTEAGAQLRTAAERLQSKVLDPLEALGIEPTLIGAETTQQRITMRLRLAGEDQLGSHTPRPQAPANSLASLQVHETAINNVLQRLDLDGRTFSLPELAQHVTERLGRSEAWDTDPEQDDVRLTFADKNALVVRCQEGRVEVILSIARLAKAPRRWTNFEVHAFFRPVVSERSIKLMREGVIHLAGTRLNNGSRMALQGVFSRSFSKDRPIDITPEPLQDNPRLADLAVTQLVIDDGWIGAALGPKASHLRQARRR